MYVLYGHYLWQCTRSPASLFVDGGKQGNREAIQHRYRRYLVHSLCMCSQADMGPISDLPSWYICTDINPSGNEE